MYSKLSYSEGLTQLENIDNFKINIQQFKLFVHITIIKYNIYIDQYNIYYYYLIFITCYK